MLCFESEGHTFDSILRSPVSGFCDFVYILLDLIMSLKVYKKQF